MFLLVESTNLDIIGREYPQIQRMSVDYPNNSEESVQSINYDKSVDYKPFLKSFSVEYRAKLTDMFSFTQSGYAFLISEKLLNIFLQSNIENYQYFEAHAIYHKKDYKYYLFFIHGQDYSLIDYQNMKFWAMDERYYYENKTRRLEAKIDKPETLINWNKIKTYPYVEYPYLEYEALKLNHANIHVDMIKPPLTVYYFVNEKLKNKIEAAKCTGVEFKTKDWRDRPIL